MALIVQLLPCAHITIRRPDGTVLLSVTTDGLQEALRERDSALLQRLKWLIRDYREGGGTMTRPAIRAYLLDKDLD